MDRNLISDDNEDENNDDVDAVPQRTNSNLSEYNF